MAGRKKKVEGRDMVEVANKNQNPQIKMKSRKYILKLANKTQIPQISQKTRKYPPATTPRRPPKSHL
ncbi:hypothetical protein LCL90_13610 [Bacillus infantis]|uniref:hypothetical protein n=1 Tax=Bacillus infantis TaxID=324767 RepID=UPI001CD20A4B|nr:hypothetical protein [Bacillus infantis]MCA1035671.1 hypothetical protein [Bacillus infantis]